jgi:hypothetical protein
MARRPDAPSLAAGLSLVLLGALALADGAGEIDVTFAAFGPVVLAVLGATLLASGLSRRD